MNIEIFDVELGQCAVVYCPNGQKIMIDAGHNASRPWRPSVHFYGQTIEHLVISNYDEDHTSDFHNLINYCNLNIIYKNPSISSSILYAMKSAQGMGNGIKAAYNWLRSIEQQSGSIIQPANLAGVEFSHYWNPYGIFTDTNNLSLITFVKYGNFTIIFPGDLEIAGWKELLKNPSFRNDLSKVTVFVASHHGRENGCCSEVFQFCQPQAIIISDAGKQHATQETCNWYASKASGCNTIGNVQRKVFTTRSDGHITINTDLYNWRIATEFERNNQFLRA
jgi:beta-lactamase superfamily II metal-dependent hydrolase